MIKIKANPFIVIIFTVFIDLLGFGILIPVIPILLADPVSPFYLLPKNFTLGQGYVLLGLLTAVYPMCQFFSASILGQLSDIFGRKRLLAISLVGTCLSYILFAYGILTQNLELLFFSRALDGITGGNISIAMAAIADVTRPENRAKSFGMIGAVFGLGFIIGPFLGGKLSDPTVLSWFNAATPFWFAAMLSFLNILSVIFLFPETLKNRQEKIRINWGQSIQNISRAFNYRGFRAIFASNFVLQAGFAFFSTFSSVFLISRFNFTQGNIGDFFAYIGLWIIFTQSVLVRVLSKKFQDYQVLRFSLFLTGFAMIGYMLPKYWWQMLFLSPFMAMGNGTSQAFMSSLVSRKAGPKIQGEILGINSSVAALGQSIPPILSGFIAQKLTPEAPVIVAGTVIIVAGIIFRMFYNQKTAVVLKV